MSILQIEDVDEPKEILNLGYQMLIGALSVLISIPFSTSYSLSYYETLSGVPSGSWWYVGLIFIIGTFMLMFLFFIARGRHIYVAFIKSFVSFMFILIFSVIINSLWKYGKIINIEYFQSLKSFFTSDIIISVSSGLSVIGISVFIPQNDEKDKKIIELFDYCDKKENMCYFPSPEGIKKIKLSDYKND